MEKILINNEEIISKMNFCISELQNGKGQILLIKGDNGYGKTSVLKHLSQIALESDIVNVLVKLSAPVGNLAVNSLQPFAPFIKTIEELSLNKQLKPEKRLAMSVGLTLLATLPIAGDIFYAVKELNRDIDEYKKKLKKEDLLRNDPMSSIWNVFVQYSSKQPFIVFIDDFHYADPQSFQLLQDITLKIKNYPILFVLTFNPAGAVRTNISLSNYLKFCEINSLQDMIIELKPFDRTLIKQLANIYFPNISVPNEFIDWLQQKTSGIPLAVSEYLQYFKDNNISISKFSPFDFDSYIPFSLQSIFTSFLQKLNDEEINILSICASEGKEFSVNLISKLLNTDVLTTIKKLKAIQIKAPIISSLGARYRYGEKTTIYQFNQSAYQIFFENLLEYEEYVAIHSQIANILKQNFDSNPDLALHNELAPLIISHSSIAGDNEKIEDTLQQQIRAAQLENDPSYLQGIHTFLENYQKSSEIPQSSENSENINSIEQNTDISAEQNFQNFIQLRFDESNTANLNFDAQFEKIEFDKIIDLILARNFDEAKRIIKLFLNQDAPIEQKNTAKLCLLKILIEEKSDEAKILLDTLKKEIDEKEKSNKVILNNLEAMYFFENGNIEKALEILQDTAKSVLSQDAFSKLLTLSNISILLKLKDNELANNYAESIEEIARKFNYQNFLEDYERYFN